MNKDEALKKYDEIREKIAAYRLALNTLAWDNATVAPKKGAAYRNQMMGIMSGELFSIETDPTYLSLIEELSQMDLDDEVKREIIQIKKDQDKSKYIPKELYVEYAQLLHDGETLWEEAKEKKDYELFKPMLKKLIDKTKEVISYRKDDRSVYDQLLDDFEPDFNTEKYDVFFDKLKKDCVPLIHEINALKTKRFAWLNEKVTVDVQRKLVQKLADFLNFSKETGLISESAHPFSEGFSAYDNRVTVKYHEDNWTSSLFALIHEVGHATYNGQVDVKYNGHHVTNSMSFGMHESQSRFFENMLGRSKAFWIQLYPFFKEEIKSLEDVSLDEFIFGINFVESSLIRIEADELTYPLHIMIRYEIEKELFNGTLDVEGLDQVWADKVESYLGIRPQNAAEGILQDIHWSGGAFGYFPTYALGSAYSAQWMHQMRKEMDVDKRLSEGNTKDILAWLQTKIHQSGGLYKAQELLVKVTGESFNPQYYVDYLVDKFKSQYQLK